ncbi:MAG TPA: hypothetical protein DER02_00275 [Gammaproteobacteria bacterium]|nr:hypothetical protein [Gammaproteobacteria bacterium]
MDDRGLNVGQKLGRSVGRDSGTDLEIDLATKPLIDLVTDSLLGLSMGFMSLCKLLKTLVFHSCCRHSASVLEGGASALRSLTTITAIMIGSAKGVQTEMVSSKTTPMRMSDTNGEKSVD